MRGWCSIVVVVAGCGRLGFDPLGGGGGQPGGDARGDTGGGGGGDDTVDALISPLCGTTVIVADDFGDGASSGPWGGTINVGSFNSIATGTAQRFTANVNATANQRGAFRQTQSTDFTGTCAIAELTVPPAGAAVYAYLRLGTPTYNVQIYLQNGQLFGSFTNGGTTGMNGPLAYSATNHRFLRIREAGGLYHFEAGPSLTSFPTSLGTEGGSLVMPSPSQLEIGLQATATVGAATSAEFGGVRFLAP